MDLRINETLQNGAVENRTYRGGLNAVRLETAPTVLPYSPSSLMNQLLSRITYCVFIIALGGDTGQVKIRGRVGAFNSPVA